MACGRAAVRACGSESIRGGAGAGRARRVAELSLRSHRMAATLYTTQHHTYRASVDPVRGGWARGRTCVFSSHAFFNTPPLYVRTKRSHARPTLPGLYALPDGQGARDEQCQNGALGAAIAAAHESGMRLAPGRNTNTTPYHAAQLRLIAPFLSFIGIGYRAIPILPCAWHFMVARLSPAHKFWGRYERTKRTSG